MAKSARFSFPQLDFQVAEQRDQIKESLEASPSLRLTVTTELSKIYKIARIKAAGETGLSEQVFPEACPYTPEQILSEDLLPERCRKAAGAAPPATP